MKSTSRRWAGPLLLSAAMLGCSAAEKQAARPVAIDQTKAARPTEKTNAPVAARPAVRQASLSDQPSVQLASVQMPMHNDEKMDGMQTDDQQPLKQHRFQAPAGTPPAPPDLSANGNLPPLGEPLSLELAEALACQHNPTLMQAQAQVQGELGKAIQAGLWPNPTLSYVQEQIGVEGTPGEFVGGTVRQRIVTGHKLDLSRQKFLARTRAAEWRALEQQYRVLNDVRVHYFRARGHFELVEIHRELVKNAEDNVLTQRERYNVGQATQADVHLANVALQRSRLDLLKNENNYREAFEVLTALLGVELPIAPLDTPLAGDLTPIDYQQALGRLSDESPQMMAARNKLDSDRIKIRRETVEPVPDIVVEGGVGNNFETTETVGMARVSVQVPLYDWNQGAIRQAEADYARQQGEIRRIELTLKQDLARTYRNYLTALQHADNYQHSILPEAQQAYELQLNSYKENRIAWNEVLRTQETYFLLRAEYIRNLIAWRENEVLITGFLLHGGLMAPETALPPGHIDSVPKPR
ncbi:TolC family protein [Lignipirellula cremea]|uniref:Cobalt-zinc-cadmium resistance protein CzcC n=1 Tax=Lignipirellula cremea TaxID=2528010 RepID=A0A518DM12_9BACT|nr:TolC family protein [Lignipirellula cremea]QDU92862.1 Cobalt-zinc-cadmium resistance protein CzcC precursor [Lignipirellula cremea]